MTQPAELAVLLGEGELFHGLPPEELVRLAGFSSPRRLNQGDTLFHQDDVCDHALILARGKVRVFLPSSGRRLEKNLDIHQPGEFLDAAGLFLEPPSHMAEAVALQSSLVIALELAAFQELLRRHASCRLVMLRLLSGQLLHSVTFRAAFLTQCAACRLAGFLLEHLLPHAELTTATRLTLPVAKKELASLLGVTPETLSRSFALLKEKGLVEMDNKTIDIINLQALDHHFNTCGKCRHHDRAPQGGVAERR